MHGTNLGAAKEAAVAELGSIAGPGGLLRSAEWRALSGSLVFLRAYPMILNTKISLCALIITRFITGRRYMMPKCTTQK